MPDPMLEDFAPLPSQATSSNLVAAGVVQAMQLARDELRLTTATPDQLNAAAAFLERALARFEEGSSRDARRFDAVQQLEAAGKAIGAELRRRAFDLGPTI